MDSPSIKVLSGMLYAFGMAGDHHTYHPTAFVTSSSQNDQALSCSRGGFPSIRHNEIRDLTADLLSEVCHNVSTEPQLQPMTGEQLTHRTDNREDGARLDVVAKSFGGNDRQSTFF